jgi:hypothetical protein
MTLQQLSSIKQWHLAHPLHPMEQQVWDGFLAVWVAGWTGLPAAWLMNSASVLMLCGLLVVLPGLYVRLRKHLHRKGALRCDWLASAAPHPR